jgi:REP element-mobilizing transposase RayT
MPDHLHAVLLIVRRMNGEFAPQRGALRSASQTLGAIVRGFKAAVTQQLRVAHSDPALLVWQRNYYEHIVRGDADLDRIRRYIEANPARWGKGSL